MTRVFKLTSMAFKHQMFHLFFFSYIVHNNHARGHRLTHEKQSFDLSHTKKGSGATVRHITITCTTSPQKLCCNVKLNLFSLIHLHAVRNQVNPCKPSKGRPIILWRWVDVNIQRMYWFCRNRTGLNIL